jgi:hypothetical protein
MGLLQYFLPLHRRAAVPATDRLQMHRGIPLGLAPLVVRRVAAVVAVGVEVPPDQGVLAKAIMALAAVQAVVVVEGLGQSATNRLALVELASAIQLMGHQ